jgi:hypothetical protein
LENISGEKQGNLRVFNLVKVKRNGFN